MRKWMVITMIIALMLLATTANAQEETTTSEIPQGIEILMLLGGLGAVSLVGGVFAVRQFTQKEEDNHAT